MGPFPHDAPPPTISASNPVGTDGFEFVEFAHAEPERLAELFTQMGYYDRVSGHDEPIDRMKTHGILIDGEGVVDGGMTRILLQVFSKTVIGPIFFEFIQRKGDEGFGEGNFRALFESIEEDQIRRGVLQADAAQ
jgi:4-hydroxyphenylpyruvate dioxygenase-like putative hemolysin